VTSGDAHPPEGEDHRGVSRRGLALLRGYVALRPRQFAVSVVGATFFSLGVVLTTVVLGRVTNELIVPAFEDGDRNRGAVLGALVVLTTLTLVRGVSLFVRRFWAARMTFGVQAHLRREVTDVYLEVPVSYHQANPTGELLAHADADVIASTEVLNPTPFTVGVLALVVFALISLALVDPVLLMVAVVLFPILSVLNHVYTTRVEAPMADVQARVGDVFGIAHESFDGALVVKLLGREAEEEARLAAAAEELREARVRVGRLRASFEPLIDALPSLATIVLLAVGAWQLSEGRITEGELVQAMALFGVLAFPMRVVGYFLQELPRGVVSYERVDEVLGEPHAPGAAVDPPATLPGGPLAFGFRHVRFGYDENPVLSDVSFEVRPGETVAMVGSTGSGKTTICELAVRLMDPDAGVVEVGGVDIAHLPPSELRAEVGLVFQETFLFADSVRNNVLLSAEATDDEVMAALAAARADRFVAALPEGLDSVLGERGVTLSGGQRQRLAIARAMLRRPRVLILDDATSAVDPVIEAEILAELRAGRSRASHDDGGAVPTTTLIVAHRLSTIELADRVVYVAGGRVVATGTHTELLADPGYEAIVSAYEEVGVA
jgi:ABC-type multidrug transport system fused ATPase/permease subunit